MKTTIGVLAARASALMSAYKQLCLLDALRPAGGTPYRGSAHPKLPVCGRAAGVARNLRKTPRQEWRTNSRTDIKRVRYVP